MPRVPHVTVLLPFYNAAATLREAIQSICDQTFPDWELLLLDDGSVDGSAELAAEAAGHDARLRLVRLPHQGIVATLQWGAQLARGCVLARMDADDWSDPRRFARQLALLEENPRLAGCGCQVRITGEAGSGLQRYEGWLNSLATAEDVRREALIECPIAHPALMVRRQAFVAVGGYQDRGWPEDHDLVLRLLAASHELANAPEPLFDWRHNPRRLSMRNPRYAEAAFRAVKRRYLFELHPLRGRRYLQWGAGLVGKRWLREWTDPQPEAVVDIHPRKIGKAIHGVPVIAPDHVPPPGEALIVVAVGAPGARADIRDWFSVRGYAEAQDYVFLA